jgi:hypothetical protein
MLPKVILCLVLLHCTSIFGQESVQVDNDRPNVPRSDEFNAWKEPPEISTDAGRDKDPGEGNSSNLSPDSFDAEDKVNPSDEADDLQEEHEYFASIDLNKGRPNLSLAIHRLHCSYI